MRSSRWCLVVVVSLAFGLANAEDIIHFTNGTSMPIRAYKIVDGMVHVDLGDDAFMAFPESVVERIEAAGVDVRLSPSSGQFKNQMIEVDPGQATETAHVPSYMRDGQDWASDETAPPPPVERDKLGVSVNRPFATAVGARRNLGASGNRAALQTKVLRNPGMGPVGTRPQGTRNVIGSAPGPKGRPPLVSATMLERPPAPPAPPDTTDAGSDSGQDDSQ